MESGVDQIKERYNEERERRVKNQSAASIFTIVVFLLLLLTYCIFLHIPLPPQFNKGEILIADAVCSTYENGFGVMEDARKHQELAKESGD
ncbi:hypothetical protein SDJN03_11379, partial [Cucurbita argyrosperma subsp. sororia]